MWFGWFVLIGCVVVWLIWLCCSVGLNWLYGLVGLIGCVVWLGLMVVLLIGLIHCVVGFNWWVQLAMWLVGLIGCAV